MHTTANGGETRTATLLTLVVAVALTLTACDNSGEDHVVCEVVVADSLELRLDPVIAHAGGAVRGITRSNSLEALEANACVDGPCFIEVDVALTTDGRPVLIHDWAGTAERFFGKRGATTHARFLARPMKHGLTPVDLPRLARWMETNPTATIILDAKGKDPLDVLARVAAEQPALVARMVPEVFRFEDYEHLRNLGYDNVFLSLYRLAATEEELLTFVETHDVLGVAMPVAKARSGLPERLLEVGIPSFVHTVNRIDTMASLRGRCVFGFYSDVLDDAPPLDPDPPPVPGFACDPGPSAASAAPNRSST